MTTTTPDTARLDTALGELNALLTRRKTHQITAGVLVTVLGSVLVAALIAGVAWLVPILGLVVLGVGVLYGLTRPSGAIEDATETIRSILAEDPEALDHTHAGSVAVARHLAVERITPLVGADRLAGYRLRAA